MPLHEKALVRHMLDDEVYASADLSVSMPKYKFPEAGRIRATRIPSCMTH